MNGVLMECFQNECLLDDREPVGVGDFSLHHLIQTGFGPHPASYTMATRGYFLRSKVVGALS
jgi:hypothetical protein